MSKHRPWLGYLLAALGVVGLLAEIGLHSWTVIRHVLGIPGDIYELNRGVLVVSAVIGFVGFYMINPAGAEGGAGILTRTAVALISVVRGGKGNVSIEVTPVDKNAVVTVPQPVGAPHPATDPAIVTAIEGGIDGAKEQVDLDEDKK